MIRRQLWWRKGEPQLLAGGLEPNPDRGRRPRLHLTLSKRFQKKRRHPGRDDADEPDRAAGRNYLVGTLWQVFTIRPATR